MQLCQDRIDVQCIGQNQCPAKTYHVEDRTCHFDQLTGEAEMGP